MSRKVIDLSVWNNGSPIDWKVVKENVDGIILRIGYRGYGSSGSLKMDSKFKEYANNCVKYNIPFGVYWFAQEITELESIETAKYIANILKNYKLSYPIYYDVEYSGAKNNTGRADSLRKNTRTNCAVAFCEEIKKLGYIAGVYASEDWFNNKLDFHKLKDYSIWCSKWNNDDGTASLRPNIKYNIWQYTSKGTIQGIKGNVDISLDESAFITNDKSIEDIANDVISGKYGNGQDRKDKLIAEGYDYIAVQDKVNELINLDKYLSTLIVGDIVTLRSDAVYYNGESIPQWVKNSKLYIREIKTNNNIVISTLKNGDITGIVNRKYLTKI